MKFRTIVILFIMAALIAAWYTKPTSEDFKKFREKNAAFTTPPVIEVQDGFVYAMYTVSYFDIKKLPKVKISNEEASVAVPKSKEKYLGLYGKFWKID
jgi:hypothetical protein